MANVRIKAKGRVSGSTGRYGARYGRFIRKRVREIEVISKALHTCPRCDNVTVKRVGTGIWECKKCSFKFAGGAYAPQTPNLKVALRAIDRTVKEV